MTSAQPLTPRERDSAVDRVRRLTIGTALASLAAVVAFGGVAAASNSGTASAASSSGSATMGTGTSSSSSGVSSSTSGSQSDSTAQNGSGLQASPQPATSSSRTAQVTSGGS